MYGLILENIHQYTCNKYGTDVWDEIRRLANIKEPTFSIHKIYPETYVPRITAHAMQVLGITEREYLYNIGISFVSMVGAYGYDKVLSVLGRHFRDFLNGLDNLHEYLRFSYPKLKPPSYFVNNETDKGMTLHYRSKRQYFLWYTIGQIEEVGRHFYQTNVTTDIVTESYENNEYYYVLQLSFDNKGYNDWQLVSNSRVDTQSSISQLPLRANTLLQIFPFCIVFNINLTIKAVGGCLQVVLPNLVGNELPKVFKILKPKVGYNWFSISGHLNTTFELASIQPLKRDTSKHNLDFKCDINSSEDNTNDSIDSNECHEYLLKLKGQMLYMEEWKCMIYLAAPNIADMDALTRTGLYLNDLSLHDFSRDMVLAGQQQTAELKLALDQELHKSKQLEVSMVKLDEEMKRTDELLYQMIPKKIAVRLRKGENPIDTCQYFSCVTILFSDIVNFTVICSRITPMQVVSMLNSMYSMFDELTVRHCVYKVETIGDAYMICSGGGIHDCQDDSVNHANKVCQIAIDMIRVTFTLPDPSGDNNLKIRIGIHTVVGGIVGQKMPRYCLFGDTVNTASRIESSSAAQMIQISEKTKAMLDPNEWDIYERGTIPLKGKGFMQTYWLYGRHSRDQLSDNSDNNDRAVDNKMLIQKVSPFNTIVSSGQINVSNDCKNLNNDQLNCFLNVNYDKLLQQQSVCDLINSDNKSKDIVDNKNAEKSLSLVSSIEGQHNTKQHHRAIDRVNRDNNNTIIKNSWISNTGEHVDSSSESQQIKGKGCFRLSSSKHKSNNVNNTTGSTRRTLSCIII
ncbi:soluble guanylate cyclase 88E-like [Oppia nitens]|uniref:soluble guanylate cyclase 88E-like n=1 Tax=Oppia nitens TaxID=1686743 RepID=UPI0023D9A33F|nr:soluble guanylate cyclase 88E-like [Oppia nitens]